MSRLKGATTPLITAAGLQSIAVASTGVVYTETFELLFGEYFGLWIIAASAGGTPDIQVDLEQSYKLPTTQGAAETTLYAVTQAVSAGINDEVCHIIKLSPIPMSYGRIKITGINSNPADTLVSGFRFIQE